LFLALGWDRRGAHLYREFDRCERSGQLERMLVTDRELISNCETELLLGDLSNPHVELAC